MAHALVFDSGVGGLSVAKEIRQLLPDITLTYAADDEFRPYGSKSEAQLKARLPGLIYTVVDAVKPDLVVIACNTASTTALSEIRALCPVPVIGVVPAIKPAAQASQSRVIAVLGTPGTVKRRYVDTLITDFAQDCHVVLQGSVALVEQAERKLAGKAVDADIILAEISPIFAGEKGDHVDAVVLACTHFPLLKDELIASSPHAVTWIDSGAAIARRVKSVLQGLSLQAKPTHPETALLIGPNCDATRQKAFAEFGFERVVAVG